LKGMCALALLCVCNKMNDRRELRRLAG
jgi:hypothetical protein